MASNFVQRPDGYAMLMSPNKDETAVHDYQGYHFPDDLAVRIRKVLPIQRACAACASCLFLFVTNMNRLSQCNNQPREPFLQGKQGQQTSSPPPAPPRLLPIDHHDLVRFAWKKTLREHETA